MRLVLALCCSLLIVSPVAAQPSAALKKASDARNAAVQRGNGKEWAKYTTDDFAVINPDGTVMSKQERMAEIEGHPLSTPLAPTEERWREYGNTAIQTFQVRPRGKPARLTVVWVKQGKAWRAASAQYTPISTP